MTDQEIIGCLGTEFSKHYQVPRERIEKAFQIARGELGNGLHAYAATQSVLVNMFRDDSKKPWLITKETEEAMKKILGK